MTKYNIPDRRYCVGEKKMVSWRIPEKLMRELEKLANLKGWTTTDLVMSALNDYIEWEKKKGHNE